MKVLSLYCKQLDLRVARMTTYNGDPSQAEDVNLVSPISIFLCWFIQPESKLLSFIFYFFVYFCCCWFIVDGNWSEWGVWGSCSQTCGVGTQTRMRTCTNPPPSGGGAGCLGSSSQSQSCNTALCMGKHCAIMYPVWKRRSVFSVNYLFISIFLERTNSRARPRYFSFYFVEKKRLAPATYVNIMWHSEHKYVTHFPAIVKSKVSK